MFKHFLITRFNLRKDDWTTNKKKIAVLTEEWHKNRFNLFTNYFNHIAGTVIDFPVVRAAPAVEAA